MKGWGVARAVGMFLGLGLVASDGLLGTSIFGPEEMGGAGEAVSQTARAGGSLR